MTHHRIDALAVVRFVRDQGGSTSAEISAKFRPDLNPKYSSWSSSFLVRLWSNGLLIRERVQTRYGRRYVYRISKSCRQDLGEEVDEISLLIARKRELQEENACLRATRVS